jgi:hypothetical protein
VVSFLWGTRKGRPTVWPIVAKCPAHRGPYLLPQLLPPAAGVAGWLSHVDHLKSYLRASMLAPQSPGVAGLLSHIDHLTSYLRAGIWLPSCWGSRFAQAEPEPEPSLSRFAEPYIAVRPGHT